MCAPVAQLDRASASGVEGHEFESRRVYHFLPFFRVIERKTQLPLFFCHSLGFYQDPAFPNTIPAQQMLWLRVRIFIYGRLLSFSKRRNRISI